MGLLLGLGLGSGLGLGLGFGDLQPRAVLLDAQRDVLDRHELHRLGPG